MAATSGIIGFVNKRLRQRRGSAALVAIAIMVLAAFFGAAIVSSMEIASVSWANNSQANQCYYIADAGVEWGCMQDSVTTGAMTLGNGSFTVTKNGSYWVSTATVGNAKSVIQCQPQAQSSSFSNGLDYVDGSRSSAVQSNLVFLMTNNTASPITFNKMQITWTPGRVTYFQYLQVKVIGGTDQQVWTKNSNPPSNYGWGKGETKLFNAGVPVNLPAHYSALMTFTNFYKTPGGAGGLSPMNPHQFVIKFYNGATLVGTIYVGVPPGITPA